MIESLNFGLVLSIKQNPRLTTSHNVPRAKNGIVTSLRMYHQEIPSKSRIPKLLPNPEIPKSIGHNFPRAQNGIATSLGMQIKETPSKS